MLVSPKYKFISILKQNESETYSAWSDVSQYVPNPFNGWNIDIGEETIDNWRDKENDNFLDCYQDAETYIMATVESP